MYKKTITYTDFNDQTFTEDFFFHLSKAEIIKMQVSERGGFTEMMKALIRDRDTATILENYDRLIRMSYGRRSPDGRQFIKRREYLEEFISCGAYDELYTELMTNDEKAIEFLNGIAPFKIDEEDRQKAIEEAGLSQYMSPSNPQTDSTTPV